jgi:IS4 transposase
MNTDKTFFAQVMEFVPWTSFTRIVQRYNADSGVRRLNCAEHLRRIKYRDPQTEQILIFLTNNTSLPAMTIAALYKSRWQVELFFKWIKQHLRIKKFLGNSENAVKTQIWCAVSTYVLIAIIRKELKINTSLYTILHILSVSVFEKSEISWAFQPDRQIGDNEDDPKQLNLLGF